MEFVNNLYHFLGCCVPIQALVGILFFSSNHTIIQNWCLTCTYKLIFVMLITHYRLRTGLEYFLFYFYLSYINS